MLRLKNNTEREFFNFMSREGYKDSTTAAYIRRLRRINPMDVLIHEDLDGYIADYEKGTHENMNKRAHRAHSCALKRLKDCAMDIGIILP